MTPLSRMIDTTISHAAAGSNSVGTEASHPVYKVVFEPLDERRFEPSWFAQNRTHSPQVSNSAARTQGAHTIDTISIPSKLGKSCSLPDGPRISIESGLSKYILPLSVKKNRVKLLGVSSSVAVESRRP